MTTNGVTDSLSYFFIINLLTWLGLFKDVKRPNRTEVNMGAKQNKKYSFERKDVICLDEFSQPIFREEVLLTKHAKVKEKSKYVLQHTRWFKVLL